MTRVSDLRLTGRRFRAPWQLTTSVVVIVALLVDASCSSSKSIDRLTIVNRTPFDVEVQVSDAGKESWHNLGQATHESSTVNELVTDVGSTWIVQFHYAGRLIDELIVKRTQLMRDRWRVEVPARVAERMRRMGFEPPLDR